ncbi:MAG: hypothetical protein JNN13_06490 [Planctomycetes bacterium]|nr:hypothetical protein [Planctomycetota bacterium]
MKHLIGVGMLAVAAPAFAQSFVDLAEARRGSHPYSSLLQIEAGAIGTLADSKDSTVGLDDTISWDGSAYYYDEAFGSRRSTVEAYAGRDGLFAGFQDGKIVGDDTVTRFELRARPWLFYRDGFYRGDTLVRNGFYEGSDYEGYLGFGREAQQGLYIELGPFYRKLRFRGSELTPPSFTLPEDYSAYGARIHVEQNTLQMDRRRGLPQEGFVVTVMGEREWNDSGPAFGAGGFATELPDAVWRARGRLEWYVPASDQATWEIYAHGGWQDEKDRVQNTEGQRPLGNIWGQGQLRLRLHLGESISLTPFGELQYTRTLDETAAINDQKWFFGAGVETYVHFSDSLSAHAWYSWVDNENRASVEIGEDVHGQQMFYVGMVLRIGATRR